MDNDISLPKSIATKLDQDTQGLWCTRDEVIGLRAEGNEWPYELPAMRPEITIGCSNRCDLVLQEPERRISRKHARVKREDGGWYVLDDNSTNGVIYDGTRVPDRSWHPIRPGGVLELSGLRILPKVRSSLRCVEARRLPESHADLM